MKTVENYQVTPDVKRWDISKFANYGDARLASFQYNYPYFVMLGDANDPRPFWVVSARTARKLHNGGYEYA